MPGLEVGERLTPAKSPTEHAVWLPAQGGISHLPVPPEMPWASATVPDPPCPHAHVPTGGRW